MKIIIKNFPDNPATALRRAGYAFQRSEGLELSFVREFSRSGYPRFHIYARMENSDLIINLHLDQKRETYGEGTRHHGEYEDSDTVKEEGERIKTVLSN